MDLDPVQLVLCALVAAACDQAARLDGTGLLVDLCRHLRIGVTDQLAPCLAVAAAGMVLVFLQ